MPCEQRAGEKWSLYSYILLYEMIRFTFFLGKTRSVMKLSPVPPTVSNLHSTSTHLGHDITHMSEPTHLASRRTELC